MPDTIVTPTVPLIERTIVAYERGLAAARLVESIDCSAEVIEEERYKIIFNEKPEG